MALHVSVGSSDTALAVVRPIRLYLILSFCWISFAPVFSIQFYLLLSPYLCFDLYFLGDDALISWVFHANQTSMCLAPHLN